MSHWVSGIGCQVTLLTLKSLDLECNVLEGARSGMSHRIHFQSLPPRPVLCRRPGGNGLGAATNDGGTEAQQHRGIGGPAGA